ncbi:hypothetical protein BDB01DRAFT_855452 [Pilobolus umbonatus]|nr:hypothetical protein BDB01DRAFT_855452 [Pilobolus umbonatus]
MPADDPYSIVGEYLSKQSPNALIVVLCVLISFTIFVWLNKSLQTPKPATTTASTNKTTDTKEKKAE